jgi:hypothetical protein
MGLTAGVLIPGGTRPKNRTLLILWKKKRWPNSWNTNLNKSHNFHFQQCMIPRIFKEAYGKYLRLWIVILKQEVLGRTNRLLSLIRHGPHWKRRVQQFFYCCVCIRYSDNVFTEPLPSNDRGIFTEPLPSNDKGIFAEPLPSNDRGIYRHTHTHTHRQQCDLISLLYFFKIRKVG